MNKKCFIILILILAVIAAVVLITFNSSNNNETVANSNETAVYDFGNFTMNVSANKNFTKTNEGFLTIFNDSQRDVSVIYILANSDSSNITIDSMEMGLSLVPTVNETDFPEIENRNSTIMDNISVHFSSGEGVTNDKYSTMYRTDNIAILIEANDLSNLINMVNSIKVKE